MRIVRYALFVLGFGGAFCRQLVLNDIPPRQQWEANFGYCGEVSLVQSTLKYGGYLSQFDARAAASPGKDQSRRGSQFLLGVNAVEACDRLRLDGHELISPSVEDFLSWVKREVLNNRPVILGVYINGLEDEDYDHIVTVVGYETDFDPQNSSYHDSDNLLFDDHFETSFVQSAPFRDFPKSRKAANAKSAPRYSLPQNTMYGLSVKGTTTGQFSLELPVRVTTNVSREVPVMAKGNVRPSDFPIQLNITVSGLFGGTAATLCAWTDENLVPVTAHELLNCTSTASKFFRVNSTTSSVVYNVRSSEKWFYRAVREPSVRRVQND